MIKIILRLENLFLFLLAIYIFSITSNNWILFLALILVPDISMLGYIRGAKIGATFYNTVHNYILGIFVMGFGTLITEPLVISIGSILLAHVAIDRFLGFGLKEPSGFKDTHLGKIGNSLPSKPPE